MIKRTFLISLAMIAGCGTLVIDPSMPAVDAGDFTLVHSACQGIPVRGIDACFVRENTDITSVWRLIVPYGTTGLEGGEVDVYYRDIHRSYPITDMVIDIPWKDFFGQTKWQSSMDGEALALVNVRYTTPEGLKEIAKFRGIAKLVVTKEGYDRLPIDSGFVGWGTTCKVQYTTAGRSAVSCK